MIEIHRIDSLESAELSPYRTLRRAVEHEKKGIFVAEGEKVVRRLFESELSVLSLLITGEWLEVLRPLLATRKNESIKVWVAEKKLLESIVGFHLHQGVMAVGKVPARLELEQTLKSIRRPFLLVALDGLTNADNIGVIVRNCVGFGVDGLIVPKNTSSPYLRRSVRMSMGAVFRLPIVSVDQLNDSLQLLQTSYGARIIAAHPHASATPIQKANLTGNICLVFGSEGSGISQEVLDVCTGRVSIPITPQTDSLNVATASGIFLFEAQRQRER